ncbi:hypothetical protein GV794_01820 [Nocardia cyriacigeorgica]|uniref:Uncharacterized protein n=1 Tax=Nocardia cyriacigeorgica TaxID=135487 RepID=A0ABX0CJI0_9NOCA|nr:hypothetical protein [Nocardia cyriacigeorgica]NEW40762.1 hypothetical protein [Nocardia cyriacigeorgica]NEW51011.1 hypothetical protein [Nocardia cyriacigeorgica]NEW54405.1 hypothetical protein [Nocardia cyriacigeorgica]
MAWTTGRYADNPSGGAHRWFWFRHQTRLLIAGLRNDPRDTGGGWTLRREWGAWAIRPVSGWRRFGWVTPPTAVTRRPQDRNAAADWMLDVITAQS